MKDNNLPLGRLSQLSLLFKEFSNGRHINRLADPQLWVELEREEESYQRLFAALGYNLQIDGRGFAWFHTEDVGSNVSKGSRQLALLFMVIFDTQADAGRPLLRFSDWAIDRALLETVHEQHEELLLAEDLDVDGLQALLDTAARFGFSQQHSGHWQLLPAVCRYLDHYETLAAAGRDSTGPAIEAQKVQEQDQEQDEEQDDNQDNKAGESAQTGPGAAGDFV